MRKWIAKKFAARGDAARARQDWPEAARAYRRAVDLDAGWAPIWVQLGHALKESGDRSGAERAYRGAIAGDPQFADGWLMLAALLLVAARSGDAGRTLQEFQGRFDTARLGPRDKAHYVRLLSQQGEAHYLRAHRNLAGAAVNDDAAYDIDRDLELAEATYLRASALNRDDGALQRGLLRVRRTLDRRSGRLPEQPGIMESIRYVNFGTTGTCNASCIHCPTGKASTDHVPRFDMPLPLFRKIVEGLKRLDLVVTEQVSFGLFGDGLVDRSVVERARIFREYYPDPMLFVNTNGAGFNSARHRPLADSNVHIGLHVESLSEGTYDRLMAPLRLKNVKPKIDEILECFMGRVHVSVPVSRLNVDELPSIRDYFLHKGACTVAFDPLFSRCQEDDSVFRSLALSPGKVACEPAVMDDLIVDCDGKVLMCCQDFQRHEPIGDFTTQTAEEVLGSMERFAARKRFAEGRHDEYSTCAQCSADHGVHGLGRVAHSA